MDSWRGSGRARPRTRRPSTKAASQRATRPMARYVRSRSGSSPGTRYRSPIHNYCQYLWAASEPTKVRRGLSLRSGYRRGTVWAQSILRSGPLPGPNLTASFRSTRPYLSWIERQASCGRYRCDLVGALALRARSRDRRNLLVAQSTEEPVDLVDDPGVRHLRVDAPRAAQYPAADRDAVGVAVDVR